MLDRFSRLSSMMLLIAVNLVPFFGILFFNWDYRFILLLYWSENLIIGFFNILKMIQAVPFLPGEYDRFRLENQQLIQTKKTPAAMKVFLILFFCLHYSFFCLIHGVFVLVLTFINISIFNSSSSSTIPLKIENIQAGDIATFLFIPFILLFISHSYSFLLNFIAQREYLKVSTMGLFFQPYIRIVIVHLAVLAGFFVIMILPDKRVPTLILILLKTAVDLGSHLYNHWRISKFKVQIRSDQYK